MYSHGTEVRRIALNQSGNATERQLLLLDRNQDLYLLHVQRRACIKLAGMCGSAIWHDRAPMLAAVVDSKLSIWHHPGVVWVDKDLLEATKTAKADRCGWPGCIPWKLYARHGVK